MAITFDDFLCPLEAALHPAAALLYPLIVALLDYAISRGGIGEPRSGLSTHMCIALAWVAVSLILYLNRAKSLRALNPAGAISCNWGEEVVVVTGGSGGIGEALVCALEKRGATVVIMDVAFPGFEMGKNTRFFKCNVSSWEAVKEVHENIIRDLGQPTILIANAAIYTPRTILSASEASLRRTIDVNVLGVLFCVKAFLPGMISCDHGHIVVMSSIKAFMTGARSVDYAASKAAVMSVVEGLHTELIHEHGNPRVKVSAVFPAVVSTGLIGGLAEAMDGFMLPTLRPDKVASRVLDVLASGNSSMVMLPALTYVGPWVRVLPDWVRVSIQDLTAKVVATFPPEENTSTR
ncbi:hypothetical protein NLG97_g7551 [Lecanicillium saksenae]|uniref:Uncharacterized protein n=1 Tax=Lecanicillium saksenae TaxID=468837 RepID=A0ACC1QMR6_9HYPO|nr:hypothetical protein NLG97_g7551 [Lecanicillium saksenae]